MKKHLLYTFILFSAYWTQAQTSYWQWAETALGGAGNYAGLYTNRVTTDAQGNVYALGNFIANAEFDNTILRNHDNGNTTSDIFLVKYDANGNMQWVVSAGGTGNDYGYGLSVNASGKILITGAFTSATMTFSSTSTSDLTINSANHNLGIDTYLAEYNASGNLVWAKDVGAGLGARSVATDRNKNILITGYLEDTVALDFDTLQPISSMSMFIVQFDSTGHELWAHAAGTQAQGISTAVDLNNNVCVTGWYGGDSINFGGVTLYTPLNQTGSQQYTVKFDAAGNPLWIQGGTGTTNGESVVTDAAGNVIVAGNAVGAAQFGNFSVGNSGSTNYSPFVLKYTPSGTLSWGKGGITSADVEVNNMDVDASGNIYTTGAAMGPVQFGNYNLPNSTGGYLMFITRYDTAGNVQLARMIGQTARTIGYGIHIDPSGNVIVGGYFTYTLNLLPNVAFQCLTSCSPIIAKMDMCQYALSTSTYTCADASAHTYTAVATLTTHSGCGWSSVVTSPANTWLHCSSADTLTNTVTIVVAQNTAVGSRTGTITIGGQILTVTQPGVGCSYSLSPATFNCTTPNANTYTNQIAVSTTAGCTWVASVTSGSSWLSTTSNSDSGSAITFSVLQNNTIYPRTGTITVQGQVVTITQPGQTCGYALSIIQLVLANYNAATLNNAVSVQTRSGCSWQAQVTQGSSWLTCTASDTVSGYVPFSVTENTTASQRTGTIDVGGQTVTIIQPGNNCTYSLNISAYNCASAVAAIYPGACTLSTQAGCAWTATVTSGGSWLSVASTDTVTGHIDISVTENTTTNLRTGNIDAGGQTLTVTQPAGTTGIAVINSNNTISVFPNPANDGVFNFAGLDNYTGIEVYNVLGQPVYYAVLNSNKHSLNLSANAAGIYFYRLTGNNNTVESGRIVFDK